MVYSDFFSLLQTFCYILLLTSTSLNCTTLLSTILFILLTPTPSLIFTLVNAGKLLFSLLFLLYFYLIMPPPLLIDLDLDLPHMLPHLYLPLCPFLFLSLLGHWTQLYHHMLLLPNLLLLNLPNAMSVQNLMMKTFAMIIAMSVWIWKASPALWIVLTAIKVCWISAGRLTCLAMTLWIWKARLALWIVLTAIKVR